MRSEGNLRYWRGADTSVFKHFSEESSSKPGPPRKLKFGNEFFGKFYAEMAHKMGISQALASRVFTTWVNFLAVELKYLFEMKVNLDDPETIAPCYHPYDSLKPAYTY